MRRKAFSLIIAAFIVALLVPAASADICNGCPGGTQPRHHRHTFPFLSIRDATDGGPFAARTVTEGDICSFIVHRSGSTKKAASVHYFTEDGTASAELGDYVPVQKPQADEESPTADFAAGARTAVIQIGTVSSEDDFDPSESPQTIETFFVHLFDPQHAKIRDGVGVCNIAESPNDIFGE